ncbi:MAG: hypothetical protein ACRC8F_03990 [Cetobacterium sp.]
MKGIIISEKDLDLYCEVKLLNEYNIFLKDNNLKNSEENYSSFIVEFLAKRKEMKGK